MLAFESDLRRPANYHHSLSRSNMATSKLARERRPRKSWSLRQLIFVNFTRRIYRVTEVAGVTWGTRNPEQAPRPNELKETEFEWAPPLKDVFRSGLVVDRFDSTSPFHRLHTDQNCAVCNTKVAQGNDETWRLAAVGRKISTESTRWMGRDAGRYGRTR
ncbi:hypothetical protein D9757_011968 [Collybiopsis confluens]|uniref:Uncharacterized protein n=1 Tax=Collybiopsis confluens TaxID=2823264 RepID=A0A8H5LPC4_9AGAR|nr:hypothetical protein D9757_011968 [Collybiopsis confluens]